MELELKQKINRLLTETRVITLCVSESTVPWASPVYFVWLNGRFYFLSSTSARHVPEGKNPLKAAAAVYHDSDVMEAIYGLQMSGTIVRQKTGISSLAAVRAYVGKFSFLKKKFGSQILEDPDFFRNRFHSRLFAFIPDEIFLSDISSAAHRSRISPDEISAQASNK